MKKKILLLMLASLLCFCLPLVGCEESSNSKIENCEHSYDGGKITIEATCEKKGQKCYTCQICGNERFEVITLNSRFRELYSELCREPWAVHGSDWSYIALDSYPSSASSKYTYFTDVYSCIEEIHDELDIPDYVLEEMVKTTAMQGKLTEVFSEITITWSYHPSNGLEVTYKVNH